MVYPIFALRDDKTSFMSPFCEMSSAAAVRGLKYALRMDALPPYVDVGDLALYQLGTFDTDTGVLVPEFPSCIYRPSSADLPTDEYTIPDEEEKAGVDIECDEEV